MAFSVAKGRVQRSASLMVGMLATSRKWLRRPSSGIFHFPILGAVQIADLRNRGKHVQRPSLNLGLQSFHCLLSVASSSVEKSHCAA